MNSNITDRRVGAFIDEMNTPENRILEKFRSDAEACRVPIILRETEGLLKCLLRLKKPARLLEIGTAVGYSACVFADACGCEVTTIEADETMAERAVSNIERLGFASNVSVLRGDGRDVLKQLHREQDAGEEGIYDMVFIDAAKSHYREFWDLCMPLVKSEALIVCDNVLMKGMTASDEFDTRGRYKTSIRKMREFLDYITGLDYAKTAVLASGDGISVSVIERNR
ncbi:MAG: O-methyltransferase [Lentihominibacter sp.]